MPHCLTFLLHDRWPGNSLVYSNGWRILPQSSFVGWPSCVDAQLTPIWWSCQVVDGVVRQSFYFSWVQNWRIVCAKLGRCFLGNLWKVSTFPGGSGKREIQLKRLFDGLCVHTHMQSIQVCASLYVWKYTCIAILDPCEARAVYFFLFFHVFLLSWAILCHLRPKALGPHRHGEFLRCLVTNCRWMRR